MFFNVFLNNLSKREWIDSYNSLPSDDDNIQRGRLAMQFVIDTHKDFPHAMYRADLGWIDFVWGKVGKPPTKSGRRKGAEGVAHILEARERKDAAHLLRGEPLLLKLVEVIAKGAVIRRFDYDDSSQKVVKYGNYEAILVKSGAGLNEWLLTGWEVN